MMRREDRERLAAMAQLTAMALDAALMRSRQASAARRGIKAQIDALDADRRRMAQSVEDPATRAGADLLWLRWAEARRAALNKSLARSLVAEEEARRVAIRAFGRDQALGKVRERETPRKA
ncbi:hypothetical protein [Actibacterium sp. D379-3]